MTPHLGLDKMPLMSSRRIADLRDVLRESPTLDGWLLYDFAAAIPWRSILQIGPPPSYDPPLVLLDPCARPTVKPMHRIEPHALDNLPGEAMLYVS